MSYRVKISAAKLNYRVTMDRVQSNTKEAANHRILGDMHASIRYYSNKSDEEITRRINSLQKEWDIERWFQVSASILSLIGVLLGFITNIFWLILPMIVLTFLFQHAVQGWCPPLPFFRYLKVRTQKEIDAEIYALKFLRNDFEKQGETQSRADFAISAVKK